MAGSWFGADGAALGAGVASAVGLYVISAYFLGKLFADGGAKPWQAWVPGLNVWRLLELGGIPGSLSLIGLVPVLGWGAIWVLGTVAAHRIARARDRPILWTALFAVAPLIWLVLFTRSPTPGALSERTSAVIDTSEGRQRDHTPTQPGATISSFLDPTRF